ncbi:MAG: hypothetical protein M3N18_11185 [Actinomycetota bacterium]|nr:hypothetical protein [Actinomycetota bacterium]
MPTVEEEQREARTTMDREGEQQPAPESWIGRFVVIGVGATGARVRGELREVSDRGVVLHYGVESGRDPGHVFYPWSNVQAIQLPDTKEQPE